MMLRLSRFASFVLVLVGLTVFASLGMAANSAAGGGGDAPSLLGQLKIVESDSLADAAGTSLLGAYDYETRTVYILKKLKGRWRQVVLYHEACHASLEDHNLHAKIPPPAEEEICDAIGNSWAAHK